MGFLGIVLIVVLIVSALLLVGIVLLQDDGGDGIGSMFGGGMGNQVGNRRGNILTRITSVLAAFFIFSAFGLALLNRTPDADAVEAAARREGVGVQQWWLDDDERDQEPSGE